MSRVHPWIYAFIGLGLLFVPFLVLARTRTTRLVFFCLSLALVNLGVGVVVLAVLAVSRLEGSRPPGLVEVLSPLWFPLLLTGLADAVILFINWKSKAH
jgi:hypothetical protein